MTRIPILCLLAAAGVLAIGCSEPAPDSVRVVHGQLDRDSFPSAVTGVYVVSAGAPVVDAPVDADGSFELWIPAGTGYEIDFVAGASNPTLVFPRGGGHMDRQFDIATPADAFDLGAVRYVGDDVAVPTYNMPGAPVDDEDSESDSDCDDDSDSDSDSDSDDDSDEDDDEDDGEDDD